MTAVAKPPIAPATPYPPLGQVGHMHMVRFTRQEVDELVRLGMVPEDATTELLDGFLVHTDRARTGDDPMSIGDDHFFSVEAFSNLRAVINGPTRHALSQQPLICTDTHEPQPDFMVVRGAFGAVRRKPTAADALCVVEVADSSYERDTGVKLVAYAQAGIRQYVVVNLRNRTAEVYETPDVVAGAYPPPRVIPADGVLELRMGENETFAVRLAEVLP